MSRERQSGRRRGVLWVIRQEGERSYVGEDDEDLKKRVRDALADPHPVRVCVLPPGCDLDAIDLDLLSSFSQESDDGEEGKQGRPARR